MRLLFFIFMFYTSPESENYKIYATILNDLKPSEAKNTIKLNKISVKTDFKFDKIEFNKSSFYSFLTDSETPKLIRKDTTWYNVLEQFNSVGNKKIKFKNKFSADIKIDFWHGRKKYQNVNKFWQRFYKRFPKAIGYAGFSNIAYSNDEKKAIVYFEISKNGLNAVGELVFLEKINEKWQIIQIHELWVA
jgi:hypothetical protein